MFRSSLVLIAFIFLISDSALSEETRFEPIIVEGVSLVDVSGSEIRSADTAEALARKVAGVSLIRRSGINNDILLRGQKRDNINVIVDEGKIYGACPNRMDPPTSHVITRNISSINVVQGPFDVEYAGTLSGIVKVETLQPQKGFHGDVGVSAGNFDFEKISGVFSGGNDSLRMFVSASSENSDQYEDGDGNDFSEQIISSIADGGAPAGSAYRTEERGREAYSKSSVMLKAFINPDSDQELRLGYTANRSDEVLYPNTPMDAKYDDSDIYNLRYSIQNIGSLSKELEIKFFHSYVDHPMWNRWRKSSDEAFPMNAGVPKLVTNHLDSTIDGITLKNTAEISEGTDLTIGIDGSLRNWNGRYDVNGMDKGASIDDVDTRNAALFLKFEQAHQDIDWQAGLRYDNSSIEVGRDELRENDYESLGANIFADYYLSDYTSFFGGLGMASRVPDARELYFEQAGKIIGTPELDQTTNYEVDIGMENSYENLNIRTRVFYSWLKDYIYYNAYSSENRFENIDASITGIELQGRWDVSSVCFLDFGVSYLRGSKDESLEGQTNKNLADIPPLRGNASLNWRYMRGGKAALELVASDDWTRIDDENGEQRLNSWATLNLKADHTFENNVRLILGVDNLLDESYALSNTYKDLTLLSFSPDAPVMLLNEPGRYFYASLSYAF